MGSASASANGWNFQVTSGIILFFDNIKNIANIKIEGKNQDIEIEYTDGSKALCQVKCKSDETTSNTDGTHLRNALKSLTAFKTSKNTTFYYISNIDNPICVPTSKKFYTTNAIFDFDELPENDKKKIISIVGDDFPSSKLRIGIFYFNGDFNGKTKFARQKIEDFCAKANIQTTINASLLLKSYTTLFFADAITSRRISRSKENFVWPIIVVALSNEASCYSDLIELCDEDEEIYDTISGLYANFIDEKTGNYEFISEFINDFQTCKKGDVSLKPIDFVKSSYTNYLHKFLVSGDDDLNAYLAKVVIYKILRNRLTINRIKTEAGIQ